MSEFQKRFAAGRLAEDLRRQPAQAAPEPAADPDDGQESVSNLGVDNRHRKSRVELRFKDGRVKSVLYADILLIDYSPEDGITLELPPHFRVRLKGVALAGLVRALSAERVAFIREMDEFTAAARQDGKPAVVTILFEKWAQ